MSDKDRLVRFFRGEADDQGRTHAEILGWSDARLEQVHDYIQWLFPLPERSGANPWAPVLDEGSIAAIRGDAAMQARLRAAFLRMLSFYGFETEDDAVVQSGSFTDSADVWLHPGNHNHLRITRILRSLRVLGLDQEAAMLWQALADLYRRDSMAGRQRITKSSFAYWQQAAKGPL